MQELRELVERGKLKAPKLQEVSFPEFDTFPAEALLPRFTLDPLKSGPCDPELKMQLPVDELQLREVIQRST